jgi:deoxyribodipyrimidine photo-lyase
MDREMTKDRIFNPITQGRKFDPNGEYTKFYVPELSNIPDEYLFNPWRNLSISNY